MSPIQAAEYTIKNFEMVAGDDQVTNDKDDLGGITSHGITLKFLRQFDPAATADDIRNMTFERAAHVAHVVLMQRGRIGEIHDWRLRAVVFDFAFHAGEDDAIPALQRVLNQIPKGGLPPLVVDGKLGSKTLTHANRLVAYEGQLAACAVLAMRQRFHILRSYAPGQSKWLRGWLRRCTALLMLVTREGVKHHVG